jgi:hypothetical protein
MSVLDHLAQAAAVIMLIELLVVLLVFLGIAGGLAFGLRWGRGKLTGVYEQVNKYSRMGAGYVDTGMHKAAQPFIMLGAGFTRLEATLEGIREQVRLARMPAAPAVAPPVPAPPPAEARSEPISEPVPEAVGARPVEAP